MKVLKIILAIAVATLLVSCKSNPKEISSKGKAYEIVVVTDIGPYQSYYYNVLNRELRIEIPGLPQAEPEFTLVNLNESAFDKMSKAHHNVLIIKQDSSVKKTVVKTRDDVWAYPQRVIYITVPDNENFDEYFTTFAPKVRELFREGEIIRSQKLIEKDLNPAIGKRIADSLGVDLKFTNNFGFGVLNKEFSWVRIETTASSLGILVYVQPYTDTSQLNYVKILDRRDEITKQYVPGAIDGSYMMIDRHNIKPIQSQLYINNYYAIETKGLWVTYGDFMGGPFVNYTLIDTVNNRIVNIDGFVYNPSGDKRNYLRSLEAVAKTVSFTKLETQD
ncbi:MAG: DUF4837 family protein [Bacteroidales bacterium]